MLGDDVVIFNRDVAHSYTDVMADLGVSIGFAKSLVSNDSFEFAKRFVFRGSVLPIVSFRELDVAYRSLDVSVTLFKRLRGDNWEMSDMVKFRGFGFRALGKLNRPYSEMGRRLSTLLTFLTIPGVSPFSWKSWVDWFTSDSAKDQSELALYYNVITEATNRHFDGNMVPFPIDPVNLSKLEKLLEVILKWYHHKDKTEMPRPK